MLRLWRGPGLVARSRLRGDPGQLGGWVNLRADFTHPFAMIIHGNPAHKQFPQIKVQRLRGNPDHVAHQPAMGATFLN
jgi:hypothetical protein